VGGEQRGEPARARAHVVVDEREQLGVGVGGGGVARPVQAARGLEDEHVRAVPASDGLRLGVAPVVDDEDAGARRRGLRRDRCERHVEVRRTALGRDDDGGVGHHGWRTT
jgi:hypothetical protein